MRLRRFAFLTVLAACGFPDPSVVPDDPEGASSADASMATPTDASLVDSVLAFDGNQNVDPDGASQEASTRPDGGGVLSPDAGCVDKCDCDRDGVRSSNPSCGATGKDCNDLDPFIPYTKGFVADKPAGHLGDWDCDGVVKKQYPVNVKCGLLSNCAAAGFTGDPGCGVEAEYVICGPGLLVTCSVAKTEKRVQGCR